MVHSPVLVLRHSEQVVDVGVLRYIAVNELQTVMGFDQGTAGLFVHVAEHDFGTIAVQILDSRCANACGCSYTQC